ncbi:site-specific DNA-methyltransferase [uncultured Thiodictyon sp.]|uniref:site-specific DNA-methyltransferase n=1 Tax=uncultured Thiodictyon sp. TaxID=1846217 RepID=UPI0025CE81A6|nr:site-specific DNA-methyltransferase [uncultured Thiodictyon sp.]
MFKLFLNRYLERASQLNFQWSTTSRDVKDGNVSHITREPEEVKAFRDTWRDGIHSYLTYLRDRLTAARDLLTDSGSIFVQIGDENVHRVRVLMDAVFGDDNFVSVISFRTTTGLGEQFLDSSCNFLLWYTRSKDTLKYRELYKTKGLADDLGGRYRRVQLEPFNRRSMTADERSGATALAQGVLVYRNDNLTSQSGGENSAFPVEYCGLTFRPGRRYWKTNQLGMQRMLRAERVASPTPRSVQYVRFLDDFAVSKFSNLWTDTQTGAFTDDKIYVVQTNAKVIERCLLMATDPGDLVRDPACGSGTTAYVAEQWGRRWITIDTSRVALALARARIMGARYPYYLLADSREGQMKEAQLSRATPSSQPIRGDLRHGFVYERVPHITLKSIANNTEIDTIWERHEQMLAPLREQLSALSGRKGVLAEREIPREPPTDWPVSTHALITTFWRERNERQKAIDASISAKADSEYLYDKPYTDNKKVRVAGPFTVESLSPHRVLGVDENDELIDPNEKQVADPDAGYSERLSFPQMILDNLKVAGVQQAHKEDRIAFTSLNPWPGDLICAEGRYVVTHDGEDPSAQPSDTSTLINEHRAALFIGPEFGTVTRPDLVTAAREAGDADFDLLIACAFNYEAHATEFSKLGRIPVLKARMNADLHMAEDLKTTGKGNLFVIFGEPDIAILPAADGQVRIKINGVDVFHPSTGEVRSDGPAGIACWFIDTDYNEESFFVRHAYFLGAADPYKALKTTLKAEINEEAWATLNSDTSRPFAKPMSGRIAVKVINHLGDEVMKVFRVA